MKNRSAIFFLLFCLFFIPGQAAHAQSSLEGAESSCRASVQAFYNWYVAKVRGGRKDWHVALKQKGQLFGPELTQSLKDSDIESKAEGDPVLDFDPILNTQDMGNRYIARRVTVKNDHCFADVYGIWSRAVHKNGSTPNVIPELHFNKRGRWVFVNFHYPNSTNPENENLLSILRYEYHPQ